MKSKMKQITQPVLDPEILFTRPFQNEFTKCIRRWPQLLAVVVPYIGNTHWGTIINFSKMILGRGCEFRLTTLRPSDTENNRLSIAEAEALSKLGVGLRIRLQPFLHSKIYQFLYHTGERAAFVGSANFSIGGFKNNDETVAFFRARADNAKVAAEIRRLWVDSVEYSRIHTRK